MTPVLRKEQRAAFRRWVALAGLAASAVGGLLAWTVYTGAEMPGQEYWLWLLPPGLTLLLGAAWSLYAQVTGSSGVVDRMTQKARARDGQATRWMVWRSGGRRWARKQLPHIRPDLTTGRSRRARAKIATGEVAAPVARVGGQWLYVTQEEMTLILGGPRMGKSGTLSCRILSAPGAVIATSTRADLFDATHRIRQRTGPVYFYDPAGVAYGMDTTIGFDPLMGCEHGPTSHDRAGDLMSGTQGSGGQDSRRDYWVGLGRDVLGALMHAAALGGYTMRDVQGWVANADDPSTHSVVVRLLDAGADPSYVSRAEQFFSNNPETRSSIQTTIMPALSWLSDPQAVATTSVEPFDVGMLLENKATVYAVATKEKAHVVPLLTALVAHIAREARRLAGARRLATPLDLCLDEVPVTCPIPLDEWTADFGGFNIRITACAQGMSQLRQRYGPDGAATILNNSAVLMQFGGAKHGEDLESVSRILGERTEVAVTKDADGKVTSRSERQVPVLTPAQISQLARGRCVVLRVGLLPALTQAPMIWSHPRVKAAERAEARAEFAAKLRRAWQRLTARAVQVGATASEKRLRTRWANKPGPHSTQPDLTPSPADYQPADYQAGSYQAGEGQQPNGRPHGRDDYTRAT